MIAGKGKRVICLKKASKGLLTILLFSVLAFGYLKSAEVYIDYKNDKYAHTASATSIESSLHQKIDEQNIYEIQVHRSEQQKEEIITSNEDESYLVNWVNSLDGSDLTQLANHRVQVDDADFIIYLKTGKEIRIKLDENNVVVSRNDNENKVFNSYLISQYELSDEIARILEIG
ncbi:hypothetical protein GLW07_12610 [Bacillus hwajinpoensis]|uniref:Uncharacterized protein n=1 Tax=Guptibacillus hwajinpoensis TaxID=208199 RepID=A0A845F036_9BACL|nr:hypothetical protein [Pseudalkalibacillus hwajinpoensis]MYL64193.1 hypothetical protein [Pseudalkalibacillus hwajinpoensis]